MKTNIIIERILKAIEENRLVPGINAADVAQHGSIEAAHNLKVEAMRVECLAKLGQLPVVAVKATRGRGVAYSISSYGCIIHAGKAAKKAGDSLRDWAREFLFMSSKINAPGFVLITADGEETFDAYKAYTGRAA